MKKRSADEVMAALGDELIVEFDEIARTAHRKFMGYPSDVMVELDPRAQAACTYAHMVAEADRRRHPGLLAPRRNGARLLRRFGLDPDCG